MKTACYRLFSLGFVFFGTLAGQDIGEELKDQRPTYTEEELLLSKYKLQLADFDVFILNPAYQGDTYEVGSALMLSNDIVVLHIEAGHHMFKDLAERAAQSIFEQGVEGCHKRGLDVHLSMNSENKKLALSPLERPVLLFRDLNKKALLTQPVVSKIVEVVDDIEEEEEGFWDWFWGAAVHKELELSDGSRWAKDDGSCFSAWEVGDHVIVSYKDDKATLINADKNIGSNQRLTEVVDGCSFLGLVEN